MCFFCALCALQLVQDFITLVDPWSGLLLASKAQCIYNIANDASVFEMELRREMKRSCHAEETPSGARGSTLR